MKPTSTTLRMGVKDLRTALTGLAKVIARKTPLPVLQCVRCHFDPDKTDTVTLTGTDLDTFLELDVPASVVTEGAPFLVPLADLRDVLKGGSAGDTVVLKSEPGERVTFLRENGSTPIPRTFTAPPVSDYPDTPLVTKPAITLEEKVRNTLLQAMACSSPDPSRFVLQGACLENGRCFVGTDGRHLYHGNSLQLPVKNTVILPYRKALDWKPLRDNGDSGDWTMALDGDQFRLAGDHWRLTSKLLDGNYPNWRQVVPPEEQFVSSVFLNDETLEQAVSVVCSLPGEKLSNKPVGLRMTRNGLTLLSAAEKEITPVEIPVADASVIGPDVTVFVNRDYLAKAMRFGLNRIDIIDHISPVRLRPENRTDREMIIMPVRASAAISTSARTSQQKPKSKSMNQDTHTTRNNGGTNGRHRSESTDTTSETTPLESAVAQIATVKDLLRQAISGLTELASTLKQAKTEQKSTEKEIRQVRSTIRTLQKVDL